MCLVENECNIDGTNLSLPRERESLPVRSRQTNVETKRSSEVFKTVRRRITAHSDQP
jgi:hypothetical protein